MLRKIILGTLAAAAVSAAAFSPSPAEAKHWKKKGWHPHYHSQFYGGYGRCHVKRWVATPHGYRFRWVNRCW